MLRCLLLLVFVQAIDVWSHSIQKKAGCETTPCNHQCIDTVDSYYCECFKNWVLQPDQHTCLHERTTATENLFMGCYADDSSDQDFRYQLWTRTDASIEECIHSCRAQGFRFAGLQKGNECWCDKSHFRPYGPSTACTIPCAGSPGQMCGGTSSNSVYRITRDHRYMGCYNENPSDIDLDVVAWDESTVASVDDCILYCSENDYLFAGVFNGGKCTCGSSYGKHGFAGEAKCSVMRCNHGWKEQNCGGNETNAIYRVTKGAYYGAQTIDVGKYADLPADLVTDFPHLKGMYAQRFAMYASDVVHAPFEDDACYTSDCYAPCGDIAVPEGFNRYKEDVVVRVFHLHLEDLHNHIDYENTPERVWLYVETLIINQDTQFEFSLSIRARQIIIDYNVNPKITFNHNGPPLGLDIEQAILRGPPSDLTFQKQSWLCSRILFSRTEETYKRVGWAIFDDLARERGYTAEQQDWLDGISALKTEYTGAMRDGIRYQPYLSRASLESRLDIYYVQIGNYETKYDELLDDATDCNTFKTRAESLLTIWVDSMVAQAGLILDLAKQAMAVSEETYYRMYGEYNESREELEVARQDFEDGIQEWQDEQARKAMFGFIGDCFNIVKGIFPVNTSATVSDVIKTGSEVSKEVLDAYSACAEDIAASMETMEQMLAMLDAMMAGVEGNEIDWTQYEGSVEEVAGLYATIEEWQVLKYTTDVLLDDPLFRSISGCMAYQMAMFDTCNWGEALTRSAIELAENMRRGIAADAIYDSKMEMKASIEAEIEALGTECAARDQMVITFAEQHYDIMIDANDALIIFCQAYFYETFKICPDNTLPKFEGDLAYLQSAINNAKLFTAAFGRTSCADVNIDILDDPSASPECKDWKLCPIKMFKETRELIFNVTLDNRREFLDINLFLVMEVRAFVTGVKSDSSITDLRFLIDVSGPFEQKKEGQYESFITRPMSSMIFQYDIETNDIIYHCDLYAGNTNQGNVQHMTPYTTWHLRIDPQWSHINLEDVTGVVFNFIGPYLNELKQNTQDNRIFVENYQTSCDDIM